MNAEVQNIDVRSYEARIKRLKEKASVYIVTGDFDKLLVTAGELMAMKQGLFEAYYQLQRDIDNRDIEKEMRA